METFLALWLPILLAAALVFVVSSILHMVMPIHRGDYVRLPNEDAVLAALRGADLRPGQYMFPCPSSMKDMGSPEMRARFVQGPVGTVIVRPSGVPAIGKSLLQWLVYSIVIGIFVAYVGATTLPAGATFGRVFQVTGTTAILGYALSYVPDSIWKGLRWSTTVKFVFDGVLYGLVTGAVFAALWPTAAA